MRHKHIAVWVVVLILSLLAIFPVAPVRAATITVTSKLDTPDPGKCRLRDAITRRTSTRRQATAPPERPAWTPLASV